MIMKKIKQVMVFSCIFLALAMASQIQQETLVSGEVNDYSEYPVISEGSASYGSAAIIGKACVVTKSKQLDRICKGDIVVTSAIHSTWYPQLRDAAAIITEKGDGSSNAIALGKKLGIPVIVGASEIMKHIIDGHIIVCDPVTRNVYHVACPGPQETHFDTLYMPQKEQGFQTLHDKLGKSGTTRPARPSTGNHDHFAPVIVDKNVMMSQDIQEYKAKRITKDVYLSHFNRFKKFVLGERKQFKWTRDWLGMGAVEAGARTIAKCDDFSVECICIGEPFYDSSDEHFMKVLNDVGQSERYIQYIDELIDECSKKPGDLNWVARVSHQEHIKSIEIPVDVKKENLIKYPKEYKKIENKVNKIDRESLIAAGLFARYWVHEKLPF
jgi:phosphohistidine swiveling domain-containing protein